VAEPTLRFPDSWTEADLDALPDDGHRYEIVDGSLLVTPPATDDHQGLGLNLAILLRQAAPAGWRVLYEVGVRVPGGNLIPDIAVLKPGSARGVEWREASDVALVVEIASKSTEATDRSLKVIKYAEAGVPAYWRVARDGAVTIHTLVAEAQYGITDVIKPGSVLAVTHPFPVSLDPAALVSEI
jgi:Uma2 family endonuclease